MFHLRKAHLGAVAVVGASFALSFAYYPFAPDRVVSHWDYAGTPDGTLPRFWGLFLLPLTLATLALVLSIVPYIDPLKANIRRFQSHYDNFVVVFLAFLLVLHIAVVSWTAGLEFNCSVVIAVGTALILFYIGSLLGHTKRNWFIGIRTPWTLSSDMVWEETHHLGAKLFRISGLIAMAGAFSGKWALLFVVVPIIVASVWSVVYSYVLHRRLHDTADEY